MPNTVFMLLSLWWSHCENSVGSRDECRTAPSGCRPLDQASWLEAHSKQHPPLQFVIIQPENWHSFCRPTESRRLGWPRPADGHPWPYCPGPEQSNLIDRDQCFASKQNYHLIAYAKKLINIQLILPHVAKAEN